MFQRTPQPSPTGCRARSLARRLVVLALALLTAAWAGAAPAWAELDPGMKGAAFEIYQNGRKVGEIYVPGRPPGTTRYVEHWVLYPAYAYPSLTNGMTITVQVSKLQPYASEQDFFARVPFAAGSRYVRVDATDTPTLPGRDARLTDRAASESERR